MAAELAQLIGDDDPSDYAAGQRPLDAETLERLRALGYLGGTGGGAGAALDPELRKINPKDRIAVFEGFNDGIDDAVELVANERWSEAEEALLELDELAPNHFIVRYYLGRAFLAQDRVEEAIEELEASLQLNPSYSFTYLQLATAYRKVDEPARAVELLREAINLLPDVSTFPMELGYLLHAQGDLDAALDAYLRGEAMAPDHAQLMRNMANLYLLRRQPQPAIVKLRRLTELEPTARPGPNSERRSRRWARCRRRATPWSAPGNSSPPTPASISTTHWCSCGCSVGIRRWPLCAAPCRPTPISTRQRRC